MLLLNRCGHRAILSLVKFISLVRKCWMVFSMHLLVPSCCRVVDRQSTPFCLLFTYRFSLFFFFFLFTFSPISEFFNFLPDDVLRLLVLTHFRLVIRFMFGTDGYISIIIDKRERPWIHSVKKF